MTVISTNGSRPPRGYFGIGAEGISKPMNFGNLSRTAHGFGASFVFTIAAQKNIGKMPSDTSASRDHLPFYNFDEPKDLVLPKDCRLVGMELTDDAIELPSFRHPLRAAYVLGPESGSLSDELTQRCDFVVKIPIHLCINVAMAGAIILYDRMICLGRFAERPIRAGGPLQCLAEPVHGKPRYSAGKKLPIDKGRHRAVDGLGKNPKLI